MSNIDEITPDTLAIVASNLANKIVHWEDSPNDVADTWRQCFYALERQIETHRAEVEEKRKRSEIAPVIKTDLDELRVALPQPLYQAIHDAYRTFLADPFNLDERPCWAGEWKRPMDLTDVDIVHLRMGSKHLGPTAIAQIRKVLPCPQKPEWNQEGCHALVRAVFEGQRTPN